MGGRAAAGGVKSDDLSRRRPFLHRWFAALVAIGAFGVLAWSVLATTGILAAADRRGARVEHITIKSKAVGRPLGVSVVVPEVTLPRAQDQRGLLVFLHGRGEDERTFLVTQMFSALGRLGRRAPIVAFPYGGDHSYWHDRAGGAWGRYVTGEVIPAVASRFGANANRVAIGGVSMGGFGVYDLARLHPGRFCAVGGHSPALWESAGLTAAGAFDNAADFARHDVIAAARARPRPFKTQPVWLDAGSRDPFRPGHAAFARALRSARAGLTRVTWPGGHDQAYWDSHWNTYLRFYATALRACRR
jgi:S-formylglutathione hydrolase FrmB